ncbi:MAG: glycoside hydrolase family 3 N-terminal domain-containing protein [Geminicoccaceae bacterium]
MPGIEALAERIDTLMAEMTLAEKVGQLTMLAAPSTVTGPYLSDDYREEIAAGRVGSVLNLYGPEKVREVRKLALGTRLGIPLFTGLDVLHGHRTVFPIPLGEAAAMSPDLWRRTAEAAARDAAADGCDLTFAPMVDVARDPRWGRIAESAGEDPWLASRFGEAKIAGFHGGGLATCAKHFVAYGAVSAGREYAETDVSERALAEVYLPPFKAALEAGVVTFMPAFTDLAGLPMTAHVALLRGLLRERWGFDGVIISDYGSTGELLEHGIAGDLAEAAALALEAGVDVDMMGGAYIKGLPIAVERGLVSEALVDEAVRRVLTLKARLGLFDDPTRESVASNWQPDLSLAREAARRSIVLLTNGPGLVPLAPDLRRIALLGPLADAPEQMLGPWAGIGDPRTAVAIRAGLQAALPEVTIEHAAGVEISGGDDSGIPAAVALAENADLVVLCLGEERGMSGEAASRASIDLPGLQRELAEAIFATGKPVVVLLSSGRPLVLPWLFDQAAAVLATWFLGHEAGNAVADVLTGRADTVGRLPVTWPRSAGQIPIHLGPRPTGRPTDDRTHYTSRWIDTPSAPQFPFGWGLSLARLRVGQMRVDRHVLSSGTTLRIEVDAANESEFATEATLFLFIRDPLASVTRPLLELRGLAKLELPAGGSGVAHFSLTTEDVTFPGVDLRPSLEPGLVRIFVGPSAGQEGLQAADIQVELGGGGTSA